MRIISDFHDYYDSVQRMGQDQSVLFIRNKKVVEQFKSRSYDYSYGKHGIIYFCGRTYPFIVMGFIKNGVYVYKFHYSENTIKIINKYDRLNVYNFFHAAHEYRFNKYIEYPIVTLWDNEITINNQLKQFSFQRIVDPYTAFNQIQEFLSNIAQARKPIPEISDVDKIQAHGFDKWSFRKMKN